MHKLKQMILKLGLKAFYTIRSGNRFFRSRSQHRICSIGVRSSRQQATSATVKSATNQLGDNQLGDTSRSTRRQLISCLSLYTFRVIRYRHIHFVGTFCGTTVS